jgi:hypothetical protein
MVRRIHQLVFLNLRLTKVDASYRPGSAGPYCAKLIEPMVGRYLSTISAIKIGLDTAELWKRTKCIYIISINCGSYVYGITANWMQLHMHAWVC